MTQLDFSAFDPKFKTALMFSIFEGLLQGKEFFLKSDENPDSIEKQFKQANVQNFSLSKKQNADGTWEIKILKKEQGSHPEGGCCGICNGPKS